MKQNERLLRHAFSSYSGKMITNYLMGFIGAIIGQVNEVSTDAYTINLNYLFVTM